MTDELGRRVAGRNLTPAAELILNATCAALKAVEKGVRLERVAEVLRDMADDFEEEHEPEPEPEPLPAALATAPWGGGMSPPGFVNIVVPIDDDHYVAAEDVQEDLAREICRCYNLVQSQDFSEAAQTFFRKEADVPSHGENRPRIFRRGNRVRTRGRDWLTGTFDSIDPETGAAVVAWDAPGGPRLSLLTELYPIKDRWETLEIGGED